ncbi:MAG: hypothetical protein HOV81_29460 [Kofleriaceae bacterium]|nr:hypothetical protein [Kofleriaceae bacterium]
MCRGVQHVLRLVALAAIAVSFAATSAYADALADARRAIDGSDYLTAKPLLEDALKAGTAGPADLAEIYKLTGIVEGALGNEKQAQTAFLRWLSLDPRGSLPPGTSPKITRPFDAAAEHAKKKGPIVAKAETDENPPAVTLVVVNDPVKLIAGAKVYFSVDRKPEQSLSADGTKRVKVELERGKRLDVRLHAVDEYGNQVVELGSRDVPIVITSSGEVKPDVVVDRKDAALVKKQPEEPPAPRPWYLSGWTWGGATIVAAGVGGYFGYRTYAELNDLDHLNANSLAHEWSEAQALEHRANRDLFVTQIAMGAAGVFALGTVILYLTRPESAAREERSESTAATRRRAGMRTTTIAPVPMQGGGAVVLGGHF